MADMGSTQGKVGGWPDYRAVWRWHFYAGLLCIPFVIWLASTGTIYIFKPQIEAVLDRPYDHFAVSGPAATPSAQVRAALDAVPGSALSAYEIAPNPQAAARIIVSKGGDKTRVYVHPTTAAVLKIVPEESRLMATVQRMHGELLIGERGSNIVELAACWAIVMIITGLFLWWPRQSSLAGVLYPRLGSGSRQTWRDLHAVTGFWVSLFAIFLLLTGLPWAKNWGAYLKDVRNIADATSTAQDWNTSRAQAKAQDKADDAGARAAMAADGDEHAEHMGHKMLPGMTMAGMRMADAADRYAPLDRILPNVAVLNLPAPVLIAPPKKPGGKWTAKSDTANRPQRVDLTMDAATGKVLSTKTFGQKHIIDRIVGVGIAAHEGQLFGWINQLVSLLTALGLILMSVSAVVLWWRRRADGVLGAPEPLSRPKLSVALTLIVLALGVYLPLFGLSLVVVLVVERLILRHIPRTRNWLGLQGA